MIRRITGLLILSVLVGCGVSGQPDATAPAPVVLADPDPKRDPLEGGIGGTGIVIAGEEGGIGGTGAPRLAAAVGTVHRFGSVYINGVRVVFPDSGVVPSPSGSLAESSIDLGETIEVLGVLKPDGSVIPTQAMFRFPLVGRVDRVDPLGTSLDIMGARVALERGALVVDESGAPVRISAGDFVQVSGLLRDDLVVASRVEKRSGPVRSSVMGVVKPGPRSGLVRINGVAVDYGSSVPPQTGWTVRVSGVHEGGRLVPYETIRSLLETLDVPVSDISVEGYLEPRAALTGLGIGGFSHDFDAGSKVTGLTGQRALFIGALDGGAFMVRHGLQLPESGEARRARLSTVRDGYAPAGAVETR